VQPQGVVNHAECRVVVSTFQREVYLPDYEGCLRGFLFVYRNEAPTLNVIISEWFFSECDIVVVTIPDHIFFPTYKKMIIL